MIFRLSYIFRRNVRGTWRKLEILTGWSLETRRRMHQSGVCIDETNWTDDCPRILQIYVYIYIYIFMYIYIIEYRFTWNREYVARENAVVNGRKGACSNIGRIFDVDVAILRCVSSVTDRLVPQWEAAARSWERQPSLVIRTNIRRPMAYTA